MVVRSSLFTDTMLPPLPTTGSQSRRWRLAATMYSDWPWALGIEEREALARDPCDALT